MAATSDSVPVSCQVSSVVSCLLFWLPDFVTSSVT